MEANLQKRLDLFVQNAHALKKEFFWYNNLTKYLGALLYAQAGKEINGEALKQCHEMVKDNTGMFSPFRGDMVVCVDALLSLAENPEAEMRATLKAYDILKGVRFNTSNFLVFAANLMAKQTAESNFENVAARARAFYDGMKSKHFFYTGEDDYIFAVMLGLTDLDAETGAERIEQLYVQLKDEFWDKNSVQTLAQVLVLGGQDESVTARVLALRDELKAQKIKLDKTYTLPLLGILALLPVDANAVMRDVMEVQELLRQEKGFGSFSVSQQEILLFAFSIVSGEAANAVVSTSIANIIIAQQTAMIVAASAGAIAASTSAASS